MMTSSNGNIFSVTGHLWGVHRSTVPVNGTGQRYRSTVPVNGTGQRWIPLTEASDAEIWSIILSVPKQTAE